MSDLKPGDRALVLPSKYPGVFGSRGPVWGGRNLAGQVVLVCAGPYLARYAADGSVEKSYSCECLGAIGAIPEWRLIRLPPDDEAKQMFRETSKPKEVQRA